MRNITILGSTGSIGMSALEVIQSNRDRFNIVGLAANSQIELLKRQLLLFKPDIVAMANKEAAKNLSDWVSSVKKSLLDGKHIDILSGETGICEVASYDKADFVLSAIVGAAGLRPTLAAIRAHKDLGLANKETLVMAGRLVMEEVVRNDTRLIPVDSEHSAIFQCMEGRKQTDVRRLILTASGGPFFGKTMDELKDVTAVDALKHPNWTMGNKITIDSATLMNKGLEVIEAHHFFGSRARKIDVLIHPQSIIHSLVEFCDGGLLAQLSMPDMKGPIAYALSYPGRIPGVVQRCNLEEIETLTFHRPDTKNFPCLQYAYEALQVGGTMPVVINAANEVLVKMFLDGVIAFNQIPVIIENVMMEHNTSSIIDDIEIIFEVDRWARERVNQKVKEKAQ